MARVKYDSKTTYNINTATPLVTVEKSFGKYGENPDQDWTETLYKKLSGMFFVYGQGGKDSPFNAIKNGEPVPGDGYEIWTSSNYNRAKAWVKMNCPEKLDEIFPAIRNDKKITTTLVLTESARDNLKMKAKEEGVSISELVRGWAESLYK